MAVRFFLPLLLTAVVTGTAAAEVALRLEGAWVRALPPTQPMTAAYLQVTNTGGAPVRVIGAEVEGAGSVEMHRSGGQDGMSAMRRIPELLLAPGEVAIFEPGGLHLMLMQLDGMPAAGEQRRVCLVTDDGGRTCTEAAVQRSAAGG